MSMNTQSLLIQNNAFIQSELEKVYYNNLLELTNLMESYDNLKKYNKITNSSELDELEAHLEKLTNSCQINSSFSEAEDFIKRFS